MFGRLRNAPPIVVPGKLGIAYRALSKFAGYCECQVWPLCPAIKAFPSGVFPI